MNSKPSRKSNTPSPFDFLPFITGRGPLPSRPITDSDIYVLRRMLLPLITDKTLINAICMMPPYTAWKVMCAVLKGKRLPKFSKPVSKVGAYFKSQSSDDKSDDREGEFLLRASERLGVDTKTHRFLYENDSRYRHLTDSYYKLINAIEDSKS